MTFGELQSDFAMNRIPEAIRWAVMKENEAELLIYQVIASCLENLDDVQIQLDKDDAVCKFLRKFQKEEALPNHALCYIEDEKKATLSCVFDLELIFEDLKVINEQFCSEVFAPRFDVYSYSYDLDVSEERLQEREAAIQKVKHVGEVTPPAESKNTN